MKPLSLELFLEVYFQALKMSSKALDRTQCITTVLSDSEAQASCMAT